MTGIGLSTGNGGRSHLGDEADAFFQKGDEGTYEGGPRSVMPSTRDLPDEDENLNAELIAGQLERRSRLQRLVTKIVVGLGVSVLLLVPARLRTTSAVAAAATESLGTMTRNPPPAQTPPVQAPPPLADLTAAPEPSIQPVAASDKVGAIGAHLASPGHKQHGTVKHSQRQGNRRAVLATRPTRTAAAVPPSHGRTNSSGSHAPPTATFPD
jgi:hypothetical protein